MAGAVREAVGRAEGLLESPEPRSVGPEDTLSPSLPTPSASCCKWRRGEGGGVKDAADHGMCLSTSADLPWLGLAWGHREANWS